MKKIVLKTYTKLIAWLLGIAGGMQACDMTTNCEYGTPSADYTISGRVTDNETQKPIKGIGVIYESKFSPYDNDTVKTDADGGYRLNLQQISPVEELSVRAEDLDGEANGGTFAGDSATIRTSEMIRTQKAGGTWHKGAFEKDGVDFYLKPKQDPPTPEQGASSATYRNEDG